MSLSVQRSVVESFSFNGKNVRSVHVPDVGQSLAAKDLYTAVGYDKENGVKTMQRLFPEKYKMRLRDVVIDKKKGSARKCPPSSRHSFIERIIPLLLFIKVQE